jgi:hypothetical protein
MVKLPSETSKKMTFMMALVKGVMTELICSSMEDADAEIGLAIAIKATIKGRILCINCRVIAIVLQYTNQQPG